jgi:hypothetical protein
MKLSVIIVVGFQYFRAITASIVCSFISLVWTNGPFQFGRCSCVEII